MRRATEGSMGSRPATSTPTATKTCSSPTSSPRRRASVNGKGRLAWRRPARAPTAAFTGFGTDWLITTATLLISSLAARQHHRIAARRPAPYRMRNQRFHNPRRGSENRRGGNPAGAHRDQPRRGFGDVDNDSDADVLVTTNNGDAVLLNSSPPRATEFRSGYARLGRTFNAGARRDRAPACRRCGGASDGRQLSLGERHRARTRRVAASRRVVVEWPDGVRGDYGRAADRIDAAAERLQ